eukprot:scaffold10625_cov79-Isochrysis_galbana.AAC.2
MLSSCSSCTTRWPSVWSGIGTSVSATPRSDPLSSSRAAPAGETSISEIEIAARSARSCRRGRGTRPATSRRRVAGCNGSSEKARTRVAPFWRTATCRRPPEASTRGAMMRMSRRGISRQPTAARGPKARRGAKGAAGRTSRLKGAEAAGATPPRRGCGARASQVHGPTISSRE